MPCISCLLESAHMEQSRVGSGGEEEDGGSHLTKKELPIFCAGKFILFRFRTMDKRIKIFIN